MLSTQFDICPGRMEKVKKTIRKEKKGKKNVFANCGATGSLEIIGPSLHAGPVVCVNLQLDSNPPNNNEKGTKKL